VAGGAVSARRAVSILIGVAMFGVAVTHADPIPQFEEHGVAPVAPIEAMPPDLASHPDATTFRSVLQEGSAHGVNFAGHYTLVMWGCGSPCNRFALIDRWTGAVYFPPIGPALGAQFRADSTLLIADPPGMIRLQCPELRHMFSTQYWVWNEQHKSFQFLDERPFDLTVQGDGARC
jgi:hypothetical protein